MMTRRNWCFGRSRLSARKCRRWLRLFSLEMETTKVAPLTGLNRNTGNLSFRPCRARSARLCEAASPSRGQVEMDASHFGGRRVRGKRGRGAFRQVPVYYRDRFNFYFGWRERGNFGIKLNFSKPPKSVPPANP
jgi:transposase